MSAEELEEPGVPSAEQVLGEVGTFLIVDASALNPDEVAALQEVLRDTWNTPNALAPARVAPALGRLMAPAELAPGGVLATHDEFLAFFDPDRTNPGARNTAARDLANLARDARSAEGQLGPSGATIEHPDELESLGLRARLFARLRPEAVDPDNVYGMLDVDALHALLKFAQARAPAGRKLSLELNQIGPGTTAHFARFVNHKLGLTGDDAWPVG